MKGRHKTAKDYYQVIEPDDSKFIPLPYPERFTTSERKLENYRCIVRNLHTMMDWPQQQSNSYNQGETAPPTGSITDFAWTTETEDWFKGHAYHRAMFKVIEVESRLSMTWHLMHSPCTLVEPNTEPK